MLFHSLPFALFLAAVFALRWTLFARNRHARNAFLLAASYLFYGWWDVRFLALIALSSAVDYAAGLAMSRHRRLALGASLAVNLGLLGVFKYAGFFAESLIAAAASAGVALNPLSVSIILPVGISFYTFQTLSYTIDVYRGTLAPTRDPLAFFAYVAFFPQLVAGPIERAARLLPQFLEDRPFAYAPAADGLRRFAWGLFKKLVVADGCAAVVSPVFADPAAHDGATLVLAAILFGMQIYADFSGYSDMAIGTASLLGFSLSRNFRNPYAAQDLRDFWGRWHISLSTWFRDYVYIPLGGNRGSRTRTAANILAVFALSGLWHGANWTFVAWGVYHAVWMLPRWRFGRLGTFAIVTVGWVLFRSASLSDAAGYLAGMADLSGYALPSATFALPLAASALMLGAEHLNRSRDHALDVAHMASAPARWALYGMVVAATAVLAAPPQSFIYFQF